MFTNLLQVEVDFQLFAEHIQNQLRILADTQLPVYVALLMMICA